MRIVDLIIMTLCTLLILSALGLEYLERTEADKRHEEAIKHLQRQITAIEERTRVNEVVIKAYAEGRI